MRKPFHTLRGTGEDPWTSVHETEVFVGNWVAFARCSCGWHTRRRNSYYSPVASFDQITELMRQFSNAADDHKAEMNTYTWKLKRFWAWFWPMLKEVWSETMTKYKLGA